MRLISYILTGWLFLTSCAKSNTYDGPIFDTHMHQDTDVSKQLESLKKYKVVKGAVSSSWDNLDKYRSETGILIGLMFPCPGGIVPYSGQKCFSDGSEFPDIDWVRQQIVGGKIDFMGEVLNEYYGISPSDSSLYPYYALA